MKEKIFWIGVLVVVFSWVGNYLYFQSKQLERPIFLDHYYEVFLQDETYLTFYYLSNKMDHSEVSYAFLDGVEAYPVSDGYLWNKTTNTPRFEQEFSHHYLKSVRLELPKRSLPIELGSDDVWSFEEITVTFTNGQTVTSDIGKVNIYGKLPNHKVFEMRVSSSSNQHRREESMVATTPLTVEAITIPFSKDLAEDVLVKVNLNQEKLKDLDALKHNENPPYWFGNERNLEWKEVDGLSINEDIFPFKLKKNDWMKLSMQFNPQRKSYFDFGVEIIGTTAKGEPFLRKSQIEDHPYLTQQAVNEIIAEKQGGRS